MLKGFKEFALRGNVIDLAVAVVVGAAFAALIGAFSAALILPVVGIFLGGGVDAGTIEINGQVIDFTLMINAVIVFVITMAVIYFVFVAPDEQAPRAHGRERRRHHPRRRQAADRDPRPAARAAGPEAVAASAAVVRRHVGEQAIVQAAEPARLVRRHVRQEVRPPRRGRRPRGSSRRR